MSATSGGRLRNSISVSANTSDFAQLLVPPSAPNRRLYVSPTPAMRRCAYFDRRQSFRAGCTSFAAAGAGVSRQIGPLLARQILLRGRDSSSSERARHRQRRLDETHSRRCVQQLGLEQMAIPGQMVDVGTARKES